MCIYIKERKSSRSLLCQVVGSRESFVAVRANVRSLLRVRAHMTGMCVSKAVAEIKGAAPQEANSFYRFRCSNLLNSRPQVGIGHECDFWG